MSWHVMGVPPWPFAFTEPPECLEVENDADETRIRYVPERTCRNVSYRIDESRFHCSECRFGCWVKDVSDGRDKLPKFCPSCGAKLASA